MFLVIVSDRGGRFNGLFFHFECIDFCLQILAHLHDCWCFAVAAAYCLKSLIYCFSKMADDTGQFYVTLIACKK